MDILERHKAYAAVILKEPLELWKAGKAAWPEENPYSNNMALNCALAWKDTPEIEFAKRELVRENGAAYYLPDRYQVCMDVYNIATNGARSFDDKLKALKLYADIMGFIEKPGATTNISQNNVTVNKVMVVPSAGSSESWEQRSLGQQAKLIEHA